MGGAMDVVSTGGAGAKVFVTIPIVTDQLTLDFET
jgi:hypothetical protein